MRRFARCGLAIRFRGMADDARAAPLMSAKRDLRRKTALSHQGGKESLN
jgi:hypothetical protein